MIAIFGTFNLLLGVTLAAYQANAWKLLYAVDPIIILTELTFIATGLGLLFKKKFAWTLHILAHSLMVSFILATTAVILWMTSFNIVQAPERTWLYIVIYGITVISIFSLVQAPRREFTTVLRIGGGQKIITVVVALSVAIVVTGWIYYFFAWQYPEDLPR